MCVRRAAHSVALTVISRRFGNTTNDVTVDYRYLREHGNDNAFNRNFATGATTLPTTFENSTNAHALYIDDKIVFGAWRITPGVRFEHIESVRKNRANTDSFESNNNKALPSLHVAYLLNQAVTLFGNYGTSFGPVQNKAGPSLTGLVIFKLALDGHNRKSASIDKCRG